MSFVDVSSRAPDFELFDQDGNLRRLADLCASGPVVLFFYPKDETTVCTREACGFRDRYEEFSTTSAQVVGISRDSKESHSAFRDNHSLPYLLLTDPRGDVARAYDVKKVLGLLPGRTTFVVDRNQNVALRFTSALDAEAHVSRALEAVRSLESQSTNAS